MEGHIKIANNSKRFILEQEEDSAVEGRTLLGGLMAVAASFAGAHWARWSFHQHKDRL